MRALALEVYRTLLPDSSLIEHLCDAQSDPTASEEIAGRSDGATSHSAVSGALGATTKLLQKVDFGAGGSAQLIETQLLKQHRPASAGAAARAAGFNLALYSEADSSQVAIEYAAALAIESVVVFTTTISAMAERAAAERRESEEAAARALELAAAATPSAAATSGRRAVESGGSASSARSTCSSSHNSARSSRRSSRASTPKGEGPSLFSVSPDGSDAEEDEVTITP